MKKILITRAANILSTPAFDRAFSTLQDFEFSFCVVDWSPEDVSRYPESLNWFRFRKKYSFLNLIKWQFYLFKMILINKPSVVWNMSFISFPFIFLLKFLFGYKVVYDCRDYFGVSYKFNFFTTFIVKIFDQLFMSSSTFGIVPDEYGKEYFNRDRKLFVVPNTVCDHGYRKSGTLEGDKIVKVGFFGYISNDRNFKVFLNLAKNNSIELHIASTHVSSDMVSLISEGKVINHGSLSHNNAQYWLSQMDYCALMYDPSIFNHRHIMPTKVFDCFVLGLPFICSKGMVELQKFCTVENQNICAQYDNMNLMLKKTRYSTWNREKYVEQYSYNKVLEYYKKIVATNLLS